MLCRQGPRRWITLRVRQGNREMDERSRERKLAIIPARLERWNHDRLRMLEEGPSWSRSVAILRYTEAGDTRTKKKIPKDLFQKFVSCLTRKFLKLIKEKKS